MATAPPASLAEACAATRAQARADRARAAGYSGWAAAIEATSHQDRDLVADRLGCSRSTIDYWRAKLGHQVGDPAAAIARAAAAGVALAAQRRDAQARGAGYPDWAAAIEATRAFGPTGAAQLLGCDPVTIHRWRRRLDRDQGRETEAWIPARRAERARAAGYPDWADAIEATLALRRCGRRPARLLRSDDPPLAGTGRPASRPGRSRPPPRGTGAGRRVPRLGQRNRGHPPVAPGHGCSPARLYPQDDLQVAKKTCPPAGLKVGRTGRNAASQIRVRFSADTGCAAQARARWRSRGAVRVRWRRRTRP